MDKPEGESVLSFQEAERRYTEAKEATAEAWKTLNLFRITEAKAAEEVARKEYETARKNHKTPATKEA